MTNQITPRLSLQKQFISKLPNNINTPFSCSRQKCRREIQKARNSLCYYNKRIVSIVIMYLLISSCIYGLFPKNNTLISQRSVAFWL